VRYEGRKLLPDVDEACGEIAGWITPRVGGVGPTTIAMLFRNAVAAAERRAGIVESAS
jgi:methylenetetrahydrofolate dehydrogenase (NADP+) / methenyltetrahydrofolate cyclohydrolase